MSTVRDKQVKNSTPDELTSLQRAAITIRELKSKLEDARKVHQEPIAIVGMACRFPGAPDLEHFWELLKNGVDAVTEVPPHRWDLEQWFDPNPNAPGKINTRYGGFIDDVECFDAAFFGIPPREARLMDPGQRILLQMVWHALEHAAIPAESLRGSNTGFFVGMSQNDYGSMQINGDPDEISAYSGTGNGGCFASGRISYQFGFNGPTLTTDTACSSSLVALCQAINALRSRESDIALASGVHLNLTPPMQIFFSRTQSFSPDGRCHTFDVGANGFVLGEGAGVVVLQRLKDALRDGRRILGVIRAANVNHGGASGGLTVPNEAAQEKLIRSVLKSGKIDPDTIDYIETHGTGTNLGDPIEVGALRSVFGGRQDDNPLQIGSVKTNIGHLNAAAGMAGLIKTVLMIQHQQIVPNLHFKKPNPEIPWKNFPVRVPTTLTPWAAKNGDVRRAGLSSFGLSGTNVHVVLEEAPDTDQSSAVRNQDRPSRLLTISAYTKKALQDLAGSHIERIKEIGSDEALADYCLRANAGRSHLEHRAAIRCSDMSSLQEGLQSVISGELHPSVLQGQSRKGAHPRLLMVLSGNPLTHLQDLLPIVPFCREELKRLSNQAGIDLTHIVEKEKSGQQSSSQAAIFTAYLVLVRMWQHWGVRPAAIQASGAGEWAAAVIGNALTAEDAFKGLSGTGNLPVLSRADMTLLNADGSRLENLTMPVSEKSISVAEGFAIEHYPGGKNISAEFGGSAEAASAWEVTLKDLSRLYISGISVDWRTFENSEDRAIPDIPGFPVYPFAPDRYWLEKTEPKASEDVDFEPAGPLPSSEVEPDDLVNEDVHSGGHTTDVNGSKATSIAQIMEMQLRMTTESLRAVTDQQFEFLRKKGFTGNGQKSVQKPKQAVPSSSLPVSVDQVQCGTWKLLLLAGNDDAELEKVKQRAIKNLTSDPESVLAESRRNLQNTLTGGKRLMLAYQSPEEAVSILEEAGNRRVISAGPLADSSSLISMFPGVGDHYLNLGKGLYDNEPFFRQIVDDCCGVIEPVLGTDLRKIIYPEPAPGTVKPESDEVKEKPRFDMKAMLGRGNAPDPLQERMNQTRFSQPLNFIIEYALGRLWEERGVRPTAMIGYSIGEYCAAVLSGVMSLEDALMLVTKRAELIETIARGAMLAVPLGEKDVEEFLGEELSVAIISTPAQSVVAGPVPAIEALEKVLAGRDITCRRLQSTHAFHTTMLKPLHEPLLELTGSFNLKKPEIPFVSNLTGTWIKDSEAVSPEYWAMHTWQTVRFSDGMGQLLSEDFPGATPGRIFLEVGPGVSLGSFMLQHPESVKRKQKMNLATLRTMYEKMPDEQFLLTTVGRLYLAGYKFLT